MARQKWRQVSSHADGTHTRSAAAVGDTKRLMQIQLTYIRTHISRPAESHLSVHIGSVHIDLSAMRMDGLADTPYVRFEHPMGRRIGQHHSGKSVTVLNRLRFEICEIDIAVSIASNRHDGHTHHRCGSRIRAVCGNGNQTNVT